MNKFVTFLIVFAVVPIFAKTVTIEGCYKFAKENSPLVNNLYIYRENSSLEKRILNKNWLPTTTLSAVTSYVSDVTSFDAISDALPIPNVKFPSPSNEQYRFTLDIQQILFDGGASHFYKKVKEAECHVNLAKTESSIYKIYEDINSIFYSIVLAGLKSRNIDLFLEKIDSNIEDTESAHRNGTVSSEVLWQLECKKVELEKEKKDIKLLRDALVNNLSILTGREINSSDSFIVDTSIVVESYQRYEIKEFDATTELLDKMYKAMMVNYIPKVFATATLGYGNPPGNDFVRDEFDFFYRVGVGLKWNIYDWGITKNRRQLLLNNGEITKHAKKTFLQKKMVTNITKKSNIERLKTKLVDDLKIVDLRKKISDLYESKMKTGTIKESEYINALTDWQSAKNIYNVDYVKFIQAKAEFKVANGIKVEGLK